MNQKTAAFSNARPGGRPWVTALCAGLVAVGIVGCGADQVSQPAVQPTKSAASQAAKPAKAVGGNRTKNPTDAEVNQCYVSKYGDGETYENARVALSAGTSKGKAVSRYFYIRRNPKTRQTTLEANCVIAKTEAAYLAAETKFVVGAKKGRLEAVRPVKMKRASKDAGRDADAPVEPLAEGADDAEPSSLGLEAIADLVPIYSTPARAMRRSPRMSPPASWECHFEVGDTAFWCGDDICYLDWQESGHYEYSCAGSGNCSWAEDGEYLYDPETWAIGVRWNSGSVKLREYRENGDPCWVDPPVEDGGSGEGDGDGHVGGRSGSYSFSLDPYPTDFLYGQSYAFHVSNPPSVSHWEFEGSTVAYCGTSPTCTFTVTEPGSLRVVASDNVRDQEAVINVMPYYGVLEEDGTECGTGGADEFSFPSDLQESIRDWARDRFLGGPNAQQIDFPASCSVEGCLQGISAEQSKAVLDAAKAAGEWQYTQGGAQGGVEDAKDRDLKRGDCIDFVWNAVMTALGTTWPNTWEQRLSTSGYKNTTATGEDLLKRRRLIRIADGQQRPGDIIVVSGHAAVYTGHVLGVPHGLANNGKPARPGVDGTDRDTGDHSFDYVSNQYPVYYLRPAIEVACLPSPLRPE